MITHLDLFTGIGAFSLAAQRTGMTTLYLSEINPDAHKVLMKNFKGAVNLGDVRELDGTWIRDFHGVDLITGGFPCTDLSNSLNGSHEGLDGKESGLFWELARIVLEADPRWVVLENVPNVMKYLETIRNEMFFHEWEAETIEFSDYGVLCRRRRTFLVGCSIPGGAKAVFDHLHQSRQTIQRRGDEDVFPMLLPWKGGVSLERLGSCVVEHAPGGVESKEIDTTRVREGNGLRRGVDLSDGARYLMLGNSITPRIPTLLFEGIMKFEEEIPDES